MWKLVLVGLLLWKESTEHWSYWLHLSSFQRIISVLVHDLWRLHSQIYIICVYMYIICSRCSNKAARTCLSCNNTEVKGQRSVVKGYGRCRLDCHQQRRNHFWVYCLSLPLSAYKGRNGIWCGFDAWWFKALHVSGNSDFLLECSCHAVDQD